MDLVCGRQHKIGIVFKWTTTRLTLNGIKLHSKPKSKKDLRATALWWVLLDASMYMCECTHTHTWICLSMCKDLSLLSSSNGQNSSQVSQWQLPSFRNLLQFAGSVGALPALPSYFDLLPLPQPRVMLCLKAAGLVHLWDKSSTEAFQRIPDPNPLWFPAPTTALSSLGLSPEIKCLLYKEYVWMFLVTLTFALSQHCNSGLL